MVIRQLKVVGFGRASSCNHECRNTYNTSPFIGVIGAHLYTSIMELLLQPLQGGLRMPKKAENITSKMSCTCAIELI